MTRPKPESITHKRRVDHLDRDGFLEQYNKGGVLQLPQVEW
jgi:hypothetical protein